MVSKFSKTKDALIRARFFWEKYLESADWNEKFHYLSASSVYLKRVFDIYSREKRSLTQVEKNRRFYQIETRLDKDDFRFVKLLRDVEIHQGDLLTSEPIAVGGQSGNYQLVCSLNFHLGELEEKLEIPESGLQIMIKPVPNNYLRIEYLNPKTGEWSGENSRMYFRCSGTIRDARGHAKRKRFEFHKLIETCLSEWERLLTYV